MRNPTFSSVSYDLFSMHFKTRMTWNFNHFMLFSHLSGFIISYRIICKLSTAFPPATNRISLLVWYSFAPCSLSISNSDFLLFLQHTSPREFAYAVLSGCNILPSFNCLQDYCLLFFFLIHITSSERPSLNGHSPLLFCVCLLHFSFQEHFTICDNALFFN